MRASTIKKKLKDQHIESDTSLEPPNLINSDEELKVDNSAKFETESIKSFKSNSSHRRETRYNQQQLEMHQDILTAIKEQSKILQLLVTQMVFSNDTSNSIKITDMDTIVPIKLEPTTIPEPIIIKSKTTILPTPQELDTNYLQKPNTSNALGLQITKVLPSDSHLFLLSTQLKDLISFKTSILKFNRDNGVNIKPQTYCSDAILTTINLELDKINPSYGYSNLQLSLLSTDDFWTVCHIIAKPNSKSDFYNILDRSHNLNLDPTFIFSNILQFNTLYKSISLYIEQFTETYNFLHKSCVINSTEANICEINNKIHGLQKLIFSKLIFTSNPIEGFEQVKTNDWIKSIWFSSQYANTKYFTLKEFTDNLKSTINNIYSTTLEQIRVALSYFPTGTPTPSSNLNITNDRLKPTNLNMVNSNITTNHSSMEDEPTFELEFIADNQYYNEEYHYNAMGEQVTNSLPLSQMPCIRQLGLVQGCKVKNCKYLHTYSAKVHEPFMETVNINFQNLKRDYESKQPTLKRSYGNNHNSHSHLLDKHPQSLKSFTFYSDMTTQEKDADINHILHNIHQTFPQIQNSISNFMKVKVVITSSTSLNEIQTEALLDSGCYWRDLISTSFITKYPELTKQLIPFNSSVVLGDNSTKIIVRSYIELKVIINGPTGYSHSGTIKCLVCDEELSSPIIIGLLSISLFFQPLLTELFKKNTNNMVIETNILNVPNNLQSFNSLNTDNDIPELQYDSDSTEAPTISDIPLTVNLTQTVEMPGTIEPVIKYFDDSINAENYKK